MDPIYAYVARQGKVLQIHSAEPIEAWLPLDKDSPHYDYFSKSPDRRFHGRSEYPSHAAIMAARDHIMEKHPTLVVLAAHLASLEHDLDGIARRLDQYPNFHVEVSSRTRDLTRHPSDRVRAFMFKYQDRLLYGVDQGWQPHLSRSVTEAQRAGAINLLELRYRIDYDYYAGKGEKSYDNRKVEALQLPRRVLEKFYHENARRLFKLDAAWQGKP
jgi:predicted TIM-barrel fold metal-dependent hydrolase